MLGLPTSEAQLRADGKGCRSDGRGIGLASLPGAPRIAVHDVANKPERACQLPGKGFAQSLSLAPLFVELAEQEVLRSDELPVTLLKPYNFCRQSSRFLLQEISFFPQYLQIFQDECLSAGRVTLVVGH